MTWPFASHSCQVGLAILMAFLRAAIATSIMQRLQDYDVGDFSFEIPGSAVGMPGRAVCIGHSREV